jgi:hypothetical protein
VLSHQGASPRPTILLHRHTTALTALLPAFWQGHTTTALVAFTAILAEFLVVALSGLPYRSGQLADEFFICGVSALVILAVMILTIAAVAWWRRNLPHLPRKPDTAGSVMTYCADSRMVDDFAGVEQMKGRARDRYVEDLGRLYEYALRRRPDGRLRWVIDHTSKVGALDGLGDMEDIEKPWAPGHQRMVSQFDD